MKNTIILISMALVINACTSKQTYDASGNFQADEVIVSAQQSGVLLSYRVTEGVELEQGEAVGQIDVKVIELEKEQTNASIDALREKTSVSTNQVELVRRELEVQKAELAQLVREQSRTANLVQSDAATQKQLDDLTAAVDQLNKQIAVKEQQLKLYVYNIDTQNSSILSEKEPMKKMVAKLDEQINKGIITNPIEGVVLANYALKGEMQTVGKPLYKIANIQTLDLKAYVTALQLAQIKIGQLVTVRIDQSKDSYKEYEGVIAWISDKSEFTPKTIQTKDERANLVYAIKVNVKNDGYLKIGMYGEVIWSK